MLGRRWPTEALHVLKDSPDRDDAQGEAPKQAKHIVTFDSSHPYIQLLQ